MVEMGCPTSERLTHPQLVSALEDLHGAWVDHVVWLRQWQRAMVHLEGWSDSDLRTDAHRRCALGRWYYAVENPQLVSRPEFSSLGEHHRRMHDAARDLGRSAQRTQEVAQSDFERFMDASLDLTEATRKLQNCLLLELADTDPLTGLRMRQGIDQALRSERARHQRGEPAASLAVIDLDQFKDLNDTHGHLAGDAALRACAQVLAEAIRPYDQLFRFGGDEFVVCLPGAGASAAVEVCQRLRRHLADTPIPIGEQPPQHLTASIGVTALSNDSLETVLDQADRALYRAKAAGGNQVRMADGIGDAGGRRIGAVSQSGGASLDSAG